MPTFLELLDADTDVAAPDDASEIDQIFDAYGVTNPPPKGNGKKRAAARRELAAGLAWFHAHYNDPFPAVNRLSHAQKTSLVEAFGHDFSAYSADDRWPLRLAHQFKATLPFDSTPTKKNRAAAARPGTRAQPQAGPVNKGVPSERGDDSDVEDGDRSSLASGPAPAYSPPDSDLGLSPFSAHHHSDGDKGSARKSARKATKKKKDKSSKRKSAKQSSSKKRKSKRKGSSSSESSGGSRDSSPSPAAASSDSGVEERSDWSLPAKMDGSEEARLQVVALCSPKWLVAETMYKGLYGNKWYLILYRGHAWDAEKLRKYEKYLPSTLQEDWKNPCWLHRLRLLYNGELGLTANAQTLTMLAAGESVADYTDAHGFIDADGLKKYEEAIGRLASFWGKIRAAHDSSVDPGQATYGCFKAQLLLMFTRRFDLMSSHLIGLTTSSDKAKRRSSREVLAHAARQCLELQAYLVKFFDDVQARAAAGQKPYPEVARFVTTRVDQVFGGAVDVFLAETVGGSARRELGRAAGKGGGGGGGDGGGGGGGGGGGCGVAAGTVLVVDGAASQTAAQPAPLPPPALMWGGQAALPYSFVAGPVGVWGPTPPSHPAPPPAQSAGVPPPPAPPAAPSQVGAKRKVQFTDGGAASAPGLVPGQAAVQLDGSGAAAGWGGLAAGGGFAFGAPAQGLAPAAVKVEKSDSGYLGLPAHRWVLGKMAPFDGPGARSPQCYCRRKYPQPVADSIGPHSTWDCPLRYIERYGRCPGFDAQGLRDPRCWADADTLTQATVEDWKRFIHGCQPQLTKAFSAPGLPKFM